MHLRNRLPRRSLPPRRGLDVLLPVILVVLAGAPAGAQESFLARGEVDVDILLNYYEQNGDRSPVTGGVGSEELDVVSTVFLVRHRVGENWTLNYRLGADGISSASVDAIDDDVSSASEQDTRAFTVVTASRKLGDDEVRLRGGFSTEYDYSSLSAGGGWSRSFRHDTTTLSVDATWFEDTVELYDIDGENRGDDGRRTLDLSLGWTQVLGPGTLLVAELSHSEQSGFLATPFHEVILAPEPGAIEGRHVAERLPDSRSRSALGLSLHHSFGSRFVLRTHARVYDDDWGIGAETLSVEPWLRIGSSRWIYAIARIHAQSGFEWFAPPGTATADQPYFTADPDLADFDSEKFGLGFQTTFDRAHRRGWRRLLRSFETRLTRYERDDGFESTSVSFGLGWRF